ncbi:hypothetical protein D1872_241180 [compost metagenome]
MDEEPTVQDEDEHGHYPSQKSAQRSGSQHNRIIQSDDYPIKQAVTDHKRKQRDGFGMTLFRPEVFQCLGKTRCVRVLSGFRYHGRQPDSHQPFAERAAAGQIGEQHEIQPRPHEISPWNPQLIAYGRKDNAEENIKHPRQTAPGVRDSLGRKVDVFVQVFDPGEQPRQPFRGQKTDHAAQRVGHQIVDVEHPVGMIEHAVDPG